LYATITGNAEICCKLMELQTRELLLKERSLQLEESRLRAAKEEKEIKEHLLSSDIDNKVVVTPTKVVATPTNVVATPTNSVSNKSQ
jgi:hypothetical protein